MAEKGYAGFTDSKNKEWAPDKAAVKIELLDSVKASMLAYCGHIMRKHGSCLQKDVVQETMSVAHRRGKLRTA